MYFLNNATFQNVVLHHVGNKQNGDALHCSNSPLQLDEETGELLKTYFLGKLKSPELFQFMHPSDLELNEVFTYVSAIFENPESLVEQSKHLATFLYEQCTHPKIKKGEFYVVYFKDCVVNKQGCDAVGLFKSENKETFLRVFPQGDNFEMQPQEGININKLDKGCLIFNVEKEDGYIATVVDNTNRVSEAQYWVDDFLQLKVREDNYFQTANTMAMYKDYVTLQLPEEFEMNRADQADLLNRTMDFFKNKEQFAMDEFTQEILKQPEVIDSFDAYRTMYQNEHDLQIAEDFSISESAVKKQQRVYKSVIKLDKNFHIYVHGDRSKIEYGEDHRGRFYRLYFSEER
ncbi:MAG: hypothetical protein CSB01_03435 [Bacteroidia bacterium]|nr:MAG: hypothetical protein CSB01_03435 [Bacteroidia bacterium]